MSIAAIGAGRSAIWGSATNALTTPNAATASLKSDATAKTIQPKPAHRIADPAQDGLRQMQEAAHQAGAFATDIMSALKAYRR
jgi:hypothetical protein